VVARSTRDEARVLIEDAAQTVEDQLPEVSNGAPQNGAPQNDEDSPDWRRVLPHVITAAFANFCFGYHIGALNGPLEQIAADLGFAGNTITQGVVVSTFLIGAFIGSVIGGPLSDAIGRRRTFQLDAIPLILGPALMASSHDVPSIVLGRLLVGIGVGVNTSLVPLYISEIAPTKYRGTLGSLCQIGTCIGIITVLLVGLPAKEVDGWWRTMFWLGTIPGFVIMGGMQFAAESPRWLGKVGKWDEAKKTLTNLWGERFVEGAMADLRAVAEADKLEKDEASWGDMVSPRYRKVVGIGAVLFILQQFAGINGVLYFSSTTFKEAGIGSDMLASAAVAASNLVGALVALYVMDRVGRRSLLMGSYGGMAASMLLLTAALAVPQLHDSGAGSVLSVVGTLAYVFTFALGAGPVTAILLPEIFNTRIRAKGMAVSLCVHWVCNYSIGLFFLEAVEKVGVASIYAFFAAVSLASVAYASSQIPETKGRSLEEIEKELYGAAPE